MAACGLRLKPTSNRQKRACFGMPVKYIHTRFPKRHDAPLRVLLGTEFSLQGLRGVDAAL